jgi:acyl carrier protein
MMAPSTNCERIQAELTEIFRNLFDDPSLVLRDSMTAADVEGWDSLNHINLIVEVERAFLVKFKLSEIQGLNDVGGLIRLIAQKVHQA